MANRIKLTPSELRTSAVKYQDGANSIQNILNVLNREQTVIRSNWEGAAFTKFDEKFNELTPKIREFSDLLQSIQTQLNSVATTIEETDAQLAADISQ